MNYISVTEAQRKDMLARVGVSRVEELYDTIPEGYLQDAPPAVEGGMSEIDLSARLAALSGVNVGAHEYVSFAGAGCYDHYSPAFIDLSPDCVFQYLGIDWVKAGKRFVQYDDVRIAQHGDRQLDLLLIAL